MELAWWQLSASLGGCESIGTTCTGQFPGRQERDQDPHHYEARQVQGRVAPRPGRWSAGGALWERATDPFITERSQLPLPHFRRRRCLASNGYIESLCIIQRYNRGF